MARRPATARPPAFPTASMLPAPVAHDPVRDAKDIAIALLAKHGWSVTAMRARLLRRGVAEADAEAAIADLVRVGLLGDKRYAEETAKLELDRKPASNEFLERKLEFKGVSERLAKRAARSAAGARTELERACDLVRKSIRPAKDPHAVRRRVLGVLARRGFDEETSIAAADRVLGPQRDELAHSDPQETPDADL